MFGAARWAAIVDTGIDDTDPATAAGASETRHGGCLRIEGASAKRGLKSANFNSQ
jgi:hypothetical protein